MTGGGAASASRGYGVADARTALIVVALVLVEILSSFESSMIYTALPAISRDLGDLGAAAWLVTAHLLGSVMMAVIGGRLGDMFGRKRVLVIVVMLCAAGSLLSAAASSIEIIIVGRAIQGASGAILPLAFGLVRETIAPRFAPFWIGVLMGAFGVGSSAGFLLGGHLSEGGDWQSIFEFTAVYSLLLLPVVLFAIPRGAQRLVRERFDFVGAILFVPAVAAVLVAITQWSRAEGDAYQAQLLLAGGIATIIFWIFFELRQASPLVDLRLLRQPRIAVANIGTCIVALGLIQTAFLFMLLLQQPAITGVGLGVGATLAGLLKVPSSLSAAFASPLSGYISSRHNSSRALVLGALLGAAGWAFLALFHVSLWQVVAASIVCSFSAYILLAGLPNLALEDAPVEQSSEVTGLMMVLRGICTAIGVQLIATFLSVSQVRLADGKSYPSEDAYVLTFSVIAASALVVAALCALRVGRGRDRAADPGRVSSPSAG